MLEGDLGERRKQGREPLGLLISGMFGMLHACVIKRHVIITLRRSHSELGGIDDGFFLQSAQTFCSVFSFKSSSGGTRGAFIT